MYSYAQHADFDSFAASIYSQARAQISRIAETLHALSLAAGVFNRLSSVNKLPKYHDKSEQTLTSTSMHTILENRLTCMWFFFFVSD